jgi:hypothetical protein
MLIKDYPPMPLDQIPTWAESNQRQLGVPDRARAGPQVKKFRRKNQQPQNPPTATMRSVEALL